jgi:hypothetical protein
MNSVFRIIALGNICSLSNNATLYYHSLNSDNGQMAFYASGQVSSIIVSTHRAETTPYCVHVTASLSTGGLASPLVLYAPFLPRLANDTDDMWVNHPTTADEFLSSSISSPMAALF